MKEEYVIVVDKFNRSENEALLPLGLYDYSDNESVQAIHIKPESSQKIQLLNNDRISELFDDFIKLSIYILVFKQCKQETKDTIVQQLSQHILIDCITLNAEEENVLKAIIYPEIFIKHLN